MNPQLGKKIEEREKQRAKVAQKMQLAFANMDKVINEYHAVSQREAEQHARTMGQYEAERTLLRDQLLVIQTQIDAQQETLTAELNATRASLEGQIETLEASFRAVENA